MTSGSDEPRPSERGADDTVVQDAAEGGVTDSNAPEGLGKRARRASLMSISGFAGAMVLRFGGNVVLAHMLVPDHFGLMALVNVLLTGLALFSDLGLGANIIQSKRGDEEIFQNTAFTLQVLRGLLLSVVACAAAVPYAMAYDEPLLATLVPATALTALISGFNSTKLFSQNRHLVMGRLAVIEVITQAVALVAMIGWAHFHRSVWALVFGVIMKDIAQLVLSHSFLPGVKNRLRWDRECAKELFTFGRWIFISTALSFLATQSDRLIFGKLITMHELGIYNIALMAATMPAVAFNRLADTVVFPLLSRLFEHGEEANRAFRDVRQPLLLGAGYVLSGVMAGGPVIIAILYDERYIEAGWMLQLLAFGAWFGILEYSLMCGILAGGLTRWIAIAAGARLLSLVVLIPLGFSLGGFRGAIMGYVCTDVVRLLVSIFGATRVGIRSVWQDVRSTAMVCFAVGVGFVCDRQAATVVPEGVGGELLRALLIFLVVSAAWAPLGLRYLAQWRAKRRASMAPAA